MSGANGNLTAAATWRLCSAASENDSEAANNIVTTTPVGSTAFTPTAIEVDGIAIKLASRVASPTGTITVDLYDVVLAAQVAGTAVTLNVSDLPLCVTADADGGWILFRFAAPVTLSANTHQVRVSTSNATQVYLFSSATTNWTRQLRTTTIQAPAAADKLLGCGEHTGAGTGNDFTVTMDSTAATDYGNGSTTLPSLAICKRCTLTWGVAASTAYRLRLSGLLVVYAGGTLNEGTVASPLPASSSHLLEFDCAAGGDFGLIVKNLATWVRQGNPLSYDRCRLNANVSAGATAITTDVATGWKSGDVIVIASTTRTYSQFERRVLSGDASGTTVNLTAALTYAHGGVAPIVAEIINLTRNSKIKPVNDSYYTYIYSQQTMSIDVDWVEFSILGLFNVTDKHGFQTNCTTGNVNIQRCAYYDCGGYPFEVIGGSNDNFVFDNNVFSLVVTGTSQWPIFSAAFAGVTYSISGNWWIGGSSITNYYGLRFNDVGGVISNNVVTGLLSTGFTLSDATINTAIGTFSGNVAHSNNGHGLGFFNVDENFLGGTIQNFTAWLNSRGMYFQQCILKRMTFDNLILFGNLIDNFQIGTTGLLYQCNFVNCNFNGYTGFTTANGLNVAGAMIECQWSNCSLGVAAGNYLVHSTADIVVAVSGITARNVFDSCDLGSATEVNFIVTTTPVVSNLIQFINHEGVAGANKVYTPYGIYAINTAEGDGGSGACLSLTPNHASSKLSIEHLLGYGMFQAPAQNGIARSVTIKLKKTAGYVSADPEIALYQNGVLIDGWDACAVTTSYQTFTLSYTPTEDGVLDLAVRCVGTAGVIYADTFGWT